MMQALLGEGLPSCLLQRALKLLTKHAHAQFTLGAMLKSGHVVAQNKADAVLLYHLTAAQGKQLRGSNRALFFGNSEGLAQDNAAAIRWCRVAATQENAYAIATLRV